MEQAYETITLKNAGDEIEARRGFINESKIRQITTFTTAENRSQVLFISEDVRRKLGLKVLGEREIRMANGESKTCTVTDLVAVHRKNGNTFMPAMVFSEVKGVLLVTTPRDGKYLIANTKNEPRRRAAAYRRVL
jgi:hypothetical protein